MSKESNALNSLSSVLQQRRPYLVTGLVNQTASGVNVAVKVVPDPSITFTKRSDGSMLRLATELKRTKTLLSNIGMHSAQFGGAVAINNTRVCLVASSTEAFLIVLARNANIQCGGGIGELPELVVLMFELLEVFRLQHVGAMEYN